MIQDNRPQHSARDTDEIFETTLRSARNLAALESHQLFVHQEWSNLHLKKKEERKKKVRISFLKKIMITDFDGSFLLCDVSQLSHDQRGGGSVTLSRRQ